MNLPGNDRKDKGIFQCCVCVVDFCELGFGGGELCAVHGGVPHSKGVACSLHGRLLFAVCPTERCVIEIHDAGISFQNAQHAENCFHVWTRLRGKAIWTQPPAGYA